MQQLDPTTPSQENRELIFDKPKESIDDTSLINKALIQT